MFALSFFIYVFMGEEEKELSTLDIYSGIVEICSEQILILQLYINIVCAISRARSSFGKIHPCIFRKKNR